LAVVTDKEAEMALARVVSFDGVTKERIEELRRQISQESGPPDDIPATELMILWDADAEKSLAIVLFENEDDYKRGDAALSAMPSGDTPGSRSGVAKYEVAIQMKR
jgi:hypothetical protein